MAKKQILNQAFVGRAAIINRNHQRPSENFFKKRTEQLGLDQDELLMAMMDTHLSGIRSVALDEIPMADDDLKEQFPYVYKPVPGRALWNMHDLRKINPNLSLAPLHAICQRPSDQQPHLEGITPLHALLYSGYRPSQFVRLSPFTLGTHHMSVFLRFQDFGRHNDRLKTVIEAEYTIPVGTKRLATQHYAMQLDVGAHYSLPRVVYEQPPVRKELLDRLNIGWESVLANLSGTLPARKSPYVKAALNLAKRPSIPNEVSELYLGLGPYRGAIPFDRLYRDDIGEQEHAVLACTRALIQNLSKTDVTYYQGACTLSISLLSGVSPAIFAKSALHRFKRTGVSFLDEGQILKMIHLLTEYTEEPRLPSQKMARQDLITELEVIAREFSYTLDQLPPALQEELYTIEHKRNAMPAWGVIPGVDEDEDED